MAVTRHDSRYRLPVRPVRSLSDNPYELQELIENPDETDDLLRLGLHRLPIREFPPLRSLAPPWPPTTAPPNSSAASTSSSPA